MTEQDQDSELEQDIRSLGVAGWITVGVLLGFLAGAIFYAIHTWNALSDVPIPPLGWLFMGLGIFFSLLVGGGLMGLLFYSSRKGRDF